MPGSGGRTGSAPVASTRASYGSSDGARLKILHVDGSVRPVDAADLVPSADLDVEQVAEPLGRGDQQLAPVGDYAADVIRQAALANETSPPRSKMKISAFSSMRRSRRRTKRPRPRRRRSVLVWTWSGEWVSTEVEGSSMVKRTRSSPRHSTGVFRGGTDLFARTVRRRRLGEPIGLPRRQRREHTLALGIRRRPENDMRGRCTPRHYYTPCTSWKPTPGPNAGRDS